jgi:oligopeptide transport system permease protein
MKARRFAIGTFFALVAGLWVVPAILPGDADTIRLDGGNQPPGPERLFGTDLKGRDMLQRTAEGARLSLAIGVSAALVSLAIGVAWGALAGYQGGRLDGLLMRIVDVLYGLPFTLLVILLIVALGQSVVTLFIALGLVEWLTMARVVRAAVRSQKELDFVTAARAIGCGPTRILFRHILPNIAPLVAATTATTIPIVVTAEAFLSFLGIGVPAPQASLGTLVREGLVTLGVFPWQFLFPAACLVALVLLPGLLARRLAAASNTGKSQ